MSDIDFSDWSNEDINDTIVEQGKRIEESERDNALLREVVDAVNRIDARLGDGWILSLDKAMTKLEVNDE